jgi:enolase
MKNRLDITAITAREIIDCRGTPTVEVDVSVDGVLRGQAAAPSGRSVGSHEARELRDGGERYGGMGALRAVKNVNEVIASSLVGQPVVGQRKIDQLLLELDGTPNKSRLGSNATVAVSLAVAKAAAASVGLPLHSYINTNSHVLPVPMMNLVNGGRLASNDLDFQEFIIMPVGADSFAQALQITGEVNAKLRELLVTRYGKIAINVGDEGGCVPPISSVREALDVLREAVSRTPWENSIVYALDVAATHLYDRTTGCYSVEGRQLTRNDMIDLFKELVASYPIVSIEDPLEEEDFDGFARLTEELDIQIVGDDLFVTSADRLAAGIQRGAANALLWKVNQIGTLTEALDTAYLAMRNGFGLVVSERSGETEDSVIADLAVGLNAGQIKTGAPVRGERTSKYNQLLRIEEELGSAASYAGRQFRKSA